MAKRNKKLIKIGFTLIIIGLSGLAFPFLTFQNSDDYRTLDALAKERASTGYSSDQYISAEPGLTVQPTVNPNLPNIPNRLSIPQIGVDMPIFSGSSANALLRGGWLFPGTSTPDRATGNTVIFGHRFRYLPPISNTFYALDKINFGDEFTFTWQGNTYKYKVTGKSTIEPTDFSVLNQTQAPTITLITCAPLFSTKQRLVITATLIE